MDNSLQEAPTSSSAADDDVGAAKQLRPSTQWGRYSRYLYLLAKLMVVGIFVGAGYWLVGRLGSVLFPIFVSLLIAYLLDPGIDRLEKRGISRTIGILIFMLVGLLGLVGILLFLYPTVTRQIANIIQKAPQVVDVVQHRTIPWAEATFKFDVPPTFQDAVAKYGTQIQQAVPDMLERAGQWVTNVATKTGDIVSSLLNLVMIPVFTFYFLRDFDAIKRRGTVILPKHHRHALVDRLGSMDEVVGAWFRGQIQVAAILGVMYAAGLSAVFWAVGIDPLSGVAIGIVAGLLNIIPYFGLLIGVILTAVVVLLEWSGIGAVVGVTGVFVVVQLLEGYVITPKIVGEKVGLSPVVVIIVLLLGGELGGLFGVLLAIPVAGAIKVILPDLIDYYQSTPFYTGLHARPAYAGSIEGFMGQANDRRFADTADAAASSADKTADGSLESTSPESSKAESTSADHATPTADASSAAADPKTAGQSTDPAAPDDKGASNDKGADLSEEATADPKSPSEQAPEASKNGSGPAADPD